MNALIQNLREGKITHRDIKIALSKKSFWHFCKVLSPDFYKESRTHLKILCETLQEFYEDKLYNDYGKPYKNIIIKMPPRHGKSRTLTNLSAWVLGKNNENKIITASFNDDLAQDFSRHTRDIISDEKSTPDDIIYQDIFDEQIKHGDASYKKWALEGKFFSYKGTGIGGSVTGRGGNFLIVDDPVKDAETAYNEIALEKIWLWYTGTFLSRAEEGAKQIVCMTPWMKGDLASRLQELQPEKWYSLEMKAFDGENMLCDELLSYDSYVDKKSIGDSAIFAANYDLIYMDIKGRLYQNLKTYQVIPTEDQTTGKVFYCDTADQGKDFLCAIFAIQAQQYLYITDILYTKDPQEETEPKTFEKIQINETKEGIIESNNGGRAFARNVIAKLQSSGTLCSVNWFHQSQNKVSRIMTNASLVQDYVLFPEGWSKRWPEFFHDLTGYQKSGKNKHDDAPDAITGLVEKYLSATQQKWGFI